MAANIKLKPFNAGIAVQRVEILKDIAKICFNNIVILFAAAAFVNLVFSLQTGISILAGGIIGIINFYGLTLSIKSSAALEMHRIKGFIAARYWIRFSIIAFIIFYLVSRNIVIPAAFIIGFTLVMASTFLAVLSAAKKEGI